MTPLAGLVPIRKPEGRTSFEALSPVKRALSSGKVGHAGTLDRFASGLLVVLAGGYTRLCPWFTALDKLYVARIRLGEETSTLDPEGEVVAEAPLPAPGALEAALPAFRGRIMQAPPAWSAVHVDGKRAYERALRGETPDLPPREVEIHELELLSLEGRDATIRVRCGSGTYIRSLARDLALAAGSRAHLVALERRAIGPLREAEAVAPGDFDPARDLRGLDPVLAEALGFRLRVLAEGRERAFSNGGRLVPAELSPLAGRVPAGGEPAGEARRSRGAASTARSLSAVFSVGGSFLGLVEETPVCLRYELVLGGAA